MKRDLFIDPNQCLRQSGKELSMILSKGAATVVRTSLALTGAVSGEHARYGNCEEMALESSPDRDPNSQSQEILRAFVKFIPDSSAHATVEIN
jgi:hypothetical protein